uniref:HLA class I histocompatibility antigen, B-40 alpha chain-like n=1 Tax=Stegastes partitus TaxID=144197 RepID=A0A3B4ZZ45_9TELE
MHGCVGDVQPDGSLTFVTGMDMYNYDGDDFLSFDDTNGVWIAPVEAALPTKRKWDGVQVLKEYTKGYLENECMKWLKEFMEFGQHTLQTSLYNFSLAPPEVFVYTSKSKVETNVVLNCMATGFYPKDIILQIKQNGRVLEKLDGVESSGVRPNDDDTFQRKDHVEILKTDVLTYSCRIIHKASDIDIEHLWTADSKTGIIIGAVIGSIVVVGAVVGLILYKTGILGRFSMLYNPCLYQQWCEIYCFRLFFYHVTDITNRAVKCCAVVCVSHQHLSYLDRIIDM